MANNAYTGSSKITTLISGDIFYIPRTSDNSDKYIEKADFDTYIDDIINGSGTWTTITIADGITETIQMGEVATYKCFEVNAKIVNSTAIAKVFKEFAYNNSVLESGSPRVTGTLEKDPAVLNINLQAVSFGQAVWQIENNTGNTLTVKYKVNKW